MKSPLFYSKILLFGEYGIIKNSKGLAIPYNTYNGELKIPLCQESEKSSFVQKSNQVLKSYADYLEKLAHQNPDIIKIDLQQIRQDIASGMYFESSIPQGYGVGSSGALVAAIYEKYAIDKIMVSEDITREKMLKLKNIFSLMESFFHGKSSGLDPLNSYLKIPLLINSQNHIETTGIPSQTIGGKGALFLIDSEIVGETAPMVQIFMENMKNKGFRKMLKTEFSKYTDACIDCFLQGNFISLVSNMKKLSKIVLSNFKPMIPEKFHELWQKGIDSEDYFLKLCGSGGGGYILGVTKDFEKAKQSLKGYKLEVVYQF